MGRRQQLWTNGDAKAHPVRPQVSLCTSNRCLLGRNRGADSAQPTIDGDLSERKKDDFGHLRNERFFRCLDGLDGSYTNFARPRPRTLTRGIELGGPKTGPHVDTLNGSKHANMKELRFKAHNGSEI